MSIFIKLFKALNANQHPGQIAFSFVLGMILGLTPLLFAHNLLVVALIFILRVNLSAVIASMVLFSGMAYLLDPVFHQLGAYVLTMPSLAAMFTDMYNHAFWRFVNFNNTVVMGSVLVAFALSVPAFVVFWVLVKTYRQRFLKWVNKFKIVRMLKSADEVSLVSGLMK